MVSVPSVGTLVDSLIKRWISSGDNKYKMFAQLSKLSTRGANRLQINPITDFDKDFSAFDKEDIARAIMEGTCYIIKNKIEKTVNNVAISSITMVGGPTNQYLWPQIVCDIFGANVRIVYSDCAGAVGASLIAGISVGFYKDEYDAKAKISPDLTLLIPDKSSVEIYCNAYSRFKKNYNL